MPITNSNRPSAPAAPGVRTHHQRAALARPVVCQRAGARLAPLGAAVAVTLGALVVQGAVTDPGGGPASAAGIGTVQPQRQVVADPGDTLWAIAEANRGDVALWRYLDTLIDLNGGTQIQAGQVVRLP